MNAYFDFINFERDSTVMSYPAEEYYNVQHLNIYGSAKFTEYLGTILTEKYGVHKSELTANVWAERQWNGKFSIYQNYQYRKYRNAFLAHFNVKPEVIEWVLKGERADEHQLVQVRTRQNALFKSVSMRVNASSTFRHKYWAYQMALLNRVHAQNEKLPIVYVIS